MKSLTVLPVMLTAAGCAVLQPTDPYGSGGASPRVIPAHEPVKLCNSTHSTPAPSYVSSVRGPADSSASLPPGSLTLDQAIQIALASNPEVAALGWDEAATEARREQAASQRLPRLTATGGYMHHLDAQRILPVGAPGEPALLSRDVVSGDLVVSMQVFAGGRLVNGIRAADLLQQAAAQRLAHNRRELVFNVTSIFCGLLAQRHVIESLEFAQQALKEHLAQVETLIAARKGARIDRLRAEVRLADVQQQLVREQNVETVQLRVLARSLGQGGTMNPESLQEEPESSCTTPEMPELGVAVARALELRADYGAARCAVEAQARNVDIARAGAWPTVALQGTYGGRWAAGPTSGSGDEYGDVGRIGLALTMPLFDGKATKAQIREQRAALEAARERLRRLELQIQVEIQTALSNLRSAAARAAAITAAIDQAREALRMEQQKYLLGQATSADVLDAQAALLDVQTTYYRAQAEKQTAAAQLQLALGHQ